VTLRIGILGAALIAPSALVRPARSVDGVEVTAVAARDRRRAERFARKSRIPQVFDGYDELLGCADVDAVYVPLPNGLHGRWTERALAAGKHVLCEKPFTANGDEAAAVAARVAQGDRVVMEAVHYRYHPLAERIRSLVAEGAIGRVTHVEAHMCIPMARPGDIRYNPALAGGATMDAGCYAIHALRTFGPGEPTVVSARAKQSSPGVDRVMEARLSYPDGATGRILTSLWSARLLDITLRLTGDAGSIKALNFAAPQIYHRLTVHSGGERRVERVPGEASYVYQLRAFRDAVRDAMPVLTDAADAVNTMRLIDAVYVAAGLSPRRPTGA
jgi:predicted dehydrogenase